MGNLRVLFIGGSGVISSACSRVAVDSGIQLFVLNRGRFPATIVRPSHTYDKTLVPFDGGWTVLGRQVTDAILDAVMDKLAAAWTI